MTTTAFVYKWTHVPTGRWYIGSRTKQGCNPDDGYICSSKTIKPLIAENLAEWHREILAVGDPAAMLELETRYLVSLDAKNDPMSYNQHNSDGKFSTSGQAPWNKGLSLPKGRVAWNRGLTKDNNPSMAKVSAKRQGQPAHNKGKPMSEEQRLKIIEIHNNRSKETCKKISEALTGRTQTEEANAKRSATLKGRVSPRKGKTYTMSEETKKKISDSIKAKAKGT
jgi:hypothetical protein